MHTGVAHVNARRNAKTTSKVKAVNAKMTQIQRNTSKLEPRSLIYGIAGKARWTSDKAGESCQSKFVLAWFDLHFYLSSYHWVFHSVTPLVFHVKA